MKVFPSSPPNPDGSNGDSGLLLLLFPEGGLLLLFPKVLNPPNGFVPIIPKCGKYPLLVFMLLIALFC